MANLNKCLIIGNISGATEEIDETRVFLVSEGPPATAPNIPLHQKPAGYSLRPFRCLLSKRLASINVRIASSRLCTSSRKASTVGDDGAPPAANSIATRWAPKLAANGKIEDGQVLGPSDLHCRRQLRHRYPTRQGAGPWICGQAR